MRRSACRMDHLLQGTREDGQTGGSRKSRMLSDGRTVKFGSSKDGLSCNVSSVLGVDGPAVPTTQYSLAPKPLPSPPNPGNAKLRSKFDDEDPTRPLRGVDLRYAFDRITAAQNLLLRIVHRCNRRRMSGRILHKVFSSPSCARLAAD